MKPHPISILLAALIALNIRSVAKLSDKEEIALFNSISSRLARGDVKALEEIKPIGLHHASGFLFIQVLQNKDVNKPTNQAIAKRAAVIITEFDDFETWYVKALQTEPNEPRWVPRERERAIDCLRYINNKATVRIFCNALSDPNTVMRTRILASHCLALLNLPDGPYKSIEWQKAASAEGIEKWKGWWVKNAEEYQN